MPGGAPIAAPPGFVGGKKASANHRASASVLRREKNADVRRYLQDQARAFLLRG
jgi:hypothetical protein